MVVVSGGTDGMGRALALARLERGDTVVALGSNPTKGRQLLAAADDAERLAGITGSLLATIRGRS
ncbi:hypothetical protein [Agromyces larvae]|uniref:SDR family NAD(P)-dependent oxidoreductase n=1 Tax=Agromyces larvae TaxID=2929802 RepID=A0ABY4BXD0_9MICO|nr:hypothetical protein [Agromyces larvae]UOE42842.1 hypothetical protein MTO99_11645 [Agromyces larvae]